MVLDVGSAVGGVGTPLLLVMILGKLGIDVLELRSAVGGVGTPLLLVSILGKDVGKIVEDGFC